MAQGMFGVAWPCCDAILKIDPETRAIIAHTVPVKPPPIDDLAAEVAKLKGAGNRREQLFQKQFEAEKTHGKVLEKKFDELFKRAKENPDTKPPTRDIDLEARGCRLGFRDRLTGTPADFPQSPIPRPPTAVRGGTRRRPPWFELAPGRTCGRRRGGWSPPPRNPQSGPPGVC